MISEKNDSIITTTDIESQNLEVNNTSSDSLSQNAVKVRNNKYISQQIAEKQFNDKYGKKYKDTNPWKVFKDKYIEEWTLKNLSIEYFYDEDLFNNGIDF